MKESQPSRRAVVSAENLWTQMLGAKNCPELAPDGLLEACATQEKLAKYVCEEHQIRALSLNTLKAAAELAVEDGGWVEFDRLRWEIYGSSLSALQAKKKASRSLGRRVTNLREENELLSQRNQGLLRGRMKLLSAYSDAIKLLRDYQSQYPELAEKLREHETRFDVRQQIAEVEAFNEKAI